MDTSVVAGERILSIDEGTEQVIVMISFSGFQNMFPLKTSVKLVLASFCLFELTLFKIVLRCPEHLKFCFF